MAWTHQIDVADPANTDLARGGAAEFRQLKTDIIERLNTVFTDINAQPLVPVAGTNWGLSGAGPPTSGGAGTGAGVANPGTTYFDTTNKICYLNINTKASPTWAGILLGDSV